MNLSNFIVTNLYVLFCLFKRLYRVAIIALLCYNKSTIFYEVGQMENIFDTLTERGLIKQTVYGEELREVLGKQKVVCYLGFDPTAASLHIGSLAAILFLVRMQRAGHTPIALVGGATGSIGDPSFRNDMRPMMSEETRHANVERIKAQISAFFDPNAENKLIVVNNEDWIKKVTWLEMLQTVGTHMSVNRMLSHDCFKTRMETGLSFLEFNYMPMQAYDFWYLNKEFGCTLELGGDDQWANILAGVELIRRKENKPVFAMTLPLLTKADGTKMGKTAGGAVWLDREMCSDYDFYQYFRDIEDVKVRELFLYLTFLPVDEIDKICNVKGKAINEAKERLAFEVTKIVRGEQSAINAQQQSRAAFGGGNDGDMRVVKVAKKDINDVLDLLIATKEASSRGEAKRLIDGKGVRIDDELIADYTYIPQNSEFVLKRGKKSIIRVVIE